MRVSSIDLVSVSIIFELILEMFQQYGSIVLILLVQYNIMYMYWHLSVILCTQPHRCCNG